VLLCALVMIAATGRVHAQVALDQFKPAPLASDGFALSRPEVLRRGAWGALALLDYANDPLVYEFESGKPDESVVKHHLVLHIGFAVAIGDRFTAFLTLPINTVMKGDENLTVNVPEADGPGLGDASIGGRVLIVGKARDAFALSGEFIGRIPTAELADSKQVYAGDKIGSYEPALVAEGRAGRFDMRVRVGGRFRKATTVGNLELGQELLYGVGARVRLATGFYAHAELYGGTVVTEFFEREQSPLELLLGAKAQTSDWFFGAAAGPGLSHGYGSPDVRIIGTIGYAPLHKEPVDSDGDGLLDPNDRCPQDPEDRDQFEDSDGCPDPDNDRDGVPDTQDQCVMEPEDKDDFEDQDGCPDPDNDRDAILDSVDQCPLEPEDKDAFEDENGCPDPDNDGDGVLDAADACPLEPGVAEEKGCAKKPTIQIENGKLMILERVEFAVNKDVILDTSERILLDVKATLDENPSFKRVRVEGHTDDVGKDARNLDLSMRRARSVARWMIEHGVAVERFEAYGCGENRPLVGNESDENRQTNRRVEFHIVDPPPPESRSTEGCKPMKID
jgi:outer membrane protein OmpA-like peptidoglycan-associated protein